MSAFGISGRDSMLMNLSGALGPFFTRNLVIVTDDAGRTGIGEVPGGEKIRQTLPVTFERKPVQPLATRSALEPPAGRSITNEH